MVHLSKFSNEHYCIQYISQIFNWTYSLYSIGTRCGGYLFLLIAWVPSFHWSNLGTPFDSNCIKAITRSRCTHKTHSREGTGWYGRTTKGHSSLPSHWTHEHTSASCEPSLAWRPRVCLPFFILYNVYEIFLMILYKMLVIPCGTFSG